jgi:hypothetical protein
MAATYEATIAGTVKAIRPGWSHDATANGRDTMQCELVSVDASYRPASGAVFLFSEKVAVATSSSANPTHIVTSEPHGIVTGQTVTVAGHSVGGVNGEHIATRISATEFTVPVASTGGSGGTVARRLIGGRIVTPAESGLGGLGVTPIATRVDVADYNAQAETRVINEVLAAGSLKAQLTRIGVILGITIHPNQVNGPACEALPCDYATLQSVLDNRSLATGYVWEFDDWDRLRMFLPGDEAAPVNVVDGNGVAVGDIRVSPSRANYYNRIILRFTKTAIASWGYFSASANFGSGELVVLGGQTYQFRLVLTNVAGYVLIGGSALESLENLCAAIALGGGAGVRYAAATIVNASADAYVNASGFVTARALTAGAAGNSITCTTTAANAVWFGEGGGGIAALALGSDEALSNVSIATDASHATDPRDLLVDSPETTSQAVADGLSAAILAVKLVQPKTLTYQTDALGLRPGQTQNNVVVDRNINGTYIIAAVSTVNTVGNAVRRTVTAVEGVVVQAADRYQDTYRRWAGTVSGSGVAVSGGGGAAGGGSAVPSIIGFGGSSVEQWPAPAASAWVAATSVQVAIDTARRGSTTGTCYVRLRATAGSVTARLRDLTNAATVGTSAAVSSTSWQTVSFPVAFTSGAALYEVQLSGSVEGADLALGSAYVE